MRKYGFVVSAIFCMLFLFVCVAPVSVFAADYTTYPGSISQVAYFTGVAQNLPIDADYVLFRSGQYTHVLAYGELEYSNGVFTGVVDTVTYTSGTYGSDAGLSYGHDDSFRMTPGNDMIYTNLEGGEQYAILTTDSKWGNPAEIALVIGVVALLLYFVLHHFFSVCRL